MMPKQIVSNHRAHLGKGVKRIFQEVRSHGFKKAFVCTDPDLLRFNVTAKIFSILEREGLPYFAFSQVRPNPTIENVQLGVIAYKLSDADYIVSVGGGSAIDTGKAVGMDAPTHAIEAFVSKRAWDMTDMFCLRAIELISKNLRSAVVGVAFSNSGLGLTHSMAHPLGALYGTPHGLANAVILPVTMAYNADCTGEKYRHIARAMGSPAPTP
jgi:alcohol dehydrogenase class IV